MVNKIKKDVVTILPYYNNKILLQLRDFKEDIYCPGMWGFFSGSIEEGELPLVAAKRELFEEINYVPNNIKFLGCFEIPLEYKNASIYYFHLDIPIEKLILNEGADLGFFSYEEIVLNKLISKKFKKEYSLINSEFIPHIVKLVLKKIHK